MKRIASFLFISVLAISAFAQASPAFQLGPNEGFVIMNSLALYQEQGGGLKFKESLALGDKVQVKGRVQKMKLDGKDRELIRVQAPSGTEGFVRSAYVVQKAALAVVRADKAIVYAEPREVKITSKSISKQTIVAVLAEGSTPEFSRVVCYDASKDSYFTDPVFVAAEDLSFADVDINATILFAAAAASKNQDIKSNLLKVIEKKYSSTIFIDEIRAALSFKGDALGASGDASAPTAQPVQAQAASSKPTVPKSGKFTVNDDGVNVRDQPDEVNGRVIGELNAGTVVEVIEATARAYSVGGQTGLWYRLVDPAGWVFGLFLDSAD
jgi:hypothetical protein